MPSTVRAVSDDQSPRDDSDDDNETSDADEDEREAPRRSARPVPARDAARGGSAKGAPAAAAPAMGVLVVIGLAAASLGAAGGWFGHDAQVKAKIRAESVPAASGSAAPAGPCGAWQQKICSGSGDTSAACTEAKAATDLLTPSTCEVALQSVPATLAKVKASRASCDSLIGKLCADLPPGSNTCNMVRERTPSFPKERCDEMLAHYDDVIAQLKQMDQQMGAQLGGAMHNTPGLSQGAPPPGMPHGGMPAGMPHAALGAPPGAGTTPGAPATKP